MIDPSQLDNWFTYHLPTPAQQEKYVTIRDAARRFAGLLNELLPDCADKTATMRHLRETVMNANATIACNE